MAITYFNNMGVLRKIKDWLKPQKSQVFENPAANEMLLKFQKDRQFEFSAQKDGGSRQDFGRRRF